MNNQPEFSIINTGMTVDSMRSSGYKSTTHALAEIIDNAIEADAVSIEVFGVSEINPDTNRIALTKLAILDNGCGMDKTTLRRSLRYGDGTRHDRKGIGRFGVGLPNSSLSQARRVDVWSWQQGHTNALHTYLSIDEVFEGAVEIPEPEHKAIPEIYLEASQAGLSDTGTLVIWSELDRVEWKRASTTFKHTEFLIGRIYRRFLCNPEERMHSRYATEAKNIGERRNISLIPVIVDDGVLVDDNEIVRVRPNDPLYLMNNTSCPDDYGTPPMFRELEGSPFEIPVLFRGKSHIVHIRASYAKPYVRDVTDPDAKWPERYKSRDAGHAPWGKHADGNLGVSMVRANREIELDASWVSGDDPRERWWTIEVDFPTALDEVFGVTNNKQGTVTFQRLSRFDWKREALPGEDSPGDVRRRMEEEGDHRAYLIDLRSQIEKAIKVMRPRVYESRKTRAGRRHAESEDLKADAKASAVIKKRADDGHKSSSDRAAETGTQKEHEEAQKESLMKKHNLPEDDAIKQIEQTLKSGNRVRWIQSQQQSPAFFDIDSLPGVMQVSLNTEHPVFSHLYELMHLQIEDLSEDESKERLLKAAAAFRILIYAWARYEDEQTDRQRRVVRDTRIEWGKYAEEFFDDDDGTIRPSDLV